MYVDKKSMKNLFIQYADNLPLDSIKTNKIPKIILLIQKIKCAKY